MPEFLNSPLIRCFLLKVASRCNINCDYCYMYNHLDQGWKLQPKLMSETTLLVAAERIRDYAIEHELDRIAIVYHGGEPLLLGTKKLIKHAEFLKQLLPTTTIEFSLQTNGVLLSESDILDFEGAGIQVSLSLDGPAKANDRHRLDHQGRSSYEATAKAMTILEEHPSVFSGVIAVIDAKNDPGEVLRFFAEKNIPQLDFLLPDANYLTLPPGRDIDPQIYLNWLTKCFDIWFDHFPNLKIRTFDSILAALMGIPSETDGFGFGDVSLITIETDGSYHDLDVLKITGEGTHLANGGVHTNSINSAISSEQVLRHRELLQKKGLSDECQSCPVVDICGGGAVAHRFNGKDFLSPSIYCLELKGLIEHARERVIGQLDSEIDEHKESLSQIREPDINDYEISRNDEVTRIFTHFANAQAEKLARVLNNIYSISSQDAVEYLLNLSDDNFRSLASQPAVVAWTEVMIKDMAGIKVHDLNGVAIQIDSGYIFSMIERSKEIEEWPSVHRPDQWLRLPFADKIYFETAESAEGGKKVLGEALLLIKQWKPSLLEEMSIISPEIQYIRDPSANPDKVVSFSDNSVPGTLYVQLMKSGGLIDASDLADSIIHEHRHQKLYLFQRVRPIVNADYPLVKSPWREELRPPSGLFHALYVFVELLEFWSFYRHSFELGEKSARECRRIIDQLKVGFEVVKSCDLTEEGKTILNILFDKYVNLSDEDRVTLIPYA